MKIEKKKKILDIVGTTLINNIGDIVLIYLLLLSLYNLFIYKKKTHNSTINIPVGNRTHDLAVG